MDNFKIIVITSPWPVDKESEKLTRLLDAGLDMLHIRKPEFSPEEITSLVESLPKEYRCKMAIHYHPQLAESLGCRAHGITSKSCHSITELSEKEYEYVFLSPIFDSISKRGYKSKFDSDTVDLSLSKSPVIALGGISRHNLGRVEKAGFSGAAMLGQVWESEDGFNDVLRFLRLRNYKFQFITNASDIEGAVLQAREALAGGCRWIQIRMKEASDDEVGEAARRISELRRKYYGATIIVDDRAALLSMPEVDGVHLGQNDLSPVDARKHGDDSKIIGLTLNRSDQLLGREYGDVDYYGIGPYRFTTTKQKLAPVLGVEGYAKINEAMKALGDKRPYVAIGGITPDDIMPLKETGVKGFAISGAITKAHDPKKMASIFSSLISQTSNNVTT